jgi:hypothetical protein
MLYWGLSGNSPDRTCGQMGGTPACILEIRVQISAQRPSTLIEIFRYFSQILQGNSMMIPQIIQPFHAI